MKNVLFATTALVAFAGAASAEIAITGMAEMGIVGGEEYHHSQFWTDVDVTFTMTGEADNGLTFGAKVDLDENGAFAGTTEGGETIYVAYGAAKLTMGDTDGAFDWALQEMNLAGGSIDDAETLHWGFSGNDGISVANLIAAAFGTPSQLNIGGDAIYDGQIATLEYSFGDFAAALSAEIDDTPVSNHGETIWGIGFKYSGDLGGTALNVGIGYQTADDLGDVTGISVDTALANGLLLGASYSVTDIDGVDEDLTHTAVGIGYEMNAIAVGVNYGQYKIDDETLSGWGLAASYDLGGGLVAQAGYGVSDSSSAFGDANTDQFSLGLAMSF